MIAVSDPSGRGNLRIYERTYPTGTLFGHPVGYSFIEVPSTGIERAENGVLVGDENEFATLLDELRGAARGRQQPDPHPRRGVAAGGHRCALPAATASVVALDPSTGAVLTMASVPGYDPNVIPDRAAFRALEDDPDDSADQSRDSAERALSARLDLQGRHRGRGDRFGRVHAGLGPQRRYGHLDLRRPARPTSAARSFGPMDMTTALTNSINTYWAQVGEQLGAETMYDLHGSLRLQRRPGARTTRNRSCRRAASTARRASCSTRRHDRYRPDCDRAGSAPGHAAADGGGRGHDRERRRADAADLRPGGHGPGRPQLGRARSRGAGGGGQRGHRRPGRRDDGERRQRGKRHRRGADGASRSPARRARPSTSRPSSAASPTRPGSSATPRPTIPRSRSPPPSSAPSGTGGEVAAPIAADVMSSLLN